MTADDYLKEAERLAKLKGAEQDKLLKLPYELMEQSYRTLADTVAMLDRLKAERLAAPAADATSRFDRLAG
jgi:hypothetical protein